MVKKILSDREYISPFEQIKQFTEDGTECWSARDLQIVLDYKRWENFSLVINKAKIACTSSNNDVADHFRGIAKMVAIGSKAKRKLDDIFLTRYACYLVVQNGDPRKKTIALGQTYFAIQTRRQEIDDKFEDKTEYRKRIELRNSIAGFNRQLAETVQNAGVIEPIDFAVFQNEGYRGLYGGLGQKEIHTKKGLKKSQKILDYMGSTELAANYFRITQTEDKIRKENIQNKEQATKTHHEVGKKVRNTIKELGGTMPEELPTPDKSIKQVEKEQIKQISRQN